MSFRADVAYAAPPDAVYAALAAPGGARGWWSTDGDVAGGVGDRIRLNWSPSEYAEFRIDHAQPPRAMRWSCIAQHDRNLPRPDEWVGTVLSFVIDPAPGGSLLRFEHEGLVPDLECYDACRGGWDFFLRRSVRELLAVGTGLPYEARPA